MPRRRQDRDRQIIEDGGEPPSSHSLAVAIAIAGASTCAAVAVTTAAFTASDEDAFVRSFWHFVEPDHDSSPLLLLCRTWPSGSARARSMDCADDCRG